MISNSLVIDRIGWALLDSIWQAALVAALLAVALRIARRAPAASRYVMCCLAMLAVLGGAASSALLRELPADRAAQQDDSSNAVAVKSGAAATLALPANTIGATELPTNPIASPARWFPVVVAIWLFGVATIGLRQFVGWVMLRRYRRYVQPPPARWLDALCNLSALLGVRRVTMALSDRLDVPIVVGVLRPAILVPLAVLNELSPRQVEAILAHELAHVRRLDYLANLVQTAIETLLFYHPAVWWIGRQIRREREHACDDIAAATCDDRIGYARALATLEQRRGMLPAPAARGSGSRGELLARVRRLVATEPVARNRTNRSWLIVALSLAPVLVVVLSIPLTTPRLTAQTTGGGATAPTSHGSGGTQPEPSSIQESDLAPAPDADRIGVGDLVAVTINDLIGPGKESVRNLRVSADGTIALPLVGEIRAVGRSEAELSAAISQAYQDKKLIPNAAVTATVLQRVSRTFSVMGKVSKPGQYDLLGPDVRLLDALALGQTQITGGSILVIRAQTRSSPARVLEIDADRLLRGDMSQNVAIHPRDVIIVDPTAGHGEYYVGGEVRRVGVYSTDGRKITAKQAIIAAGMSETPPEQLIIRLLRRHADRTEEWAMWDVSLADLLNGKASDVVLKPDDQLQVLTKDKAAPRPTTMPGSRPSR